MNLDLLIKWATRGGWRVSTGNKLYERIYIQKEACADVPLVLNCIRREISAAFV